MSRYSQCFDNPPVRTGTFSLKWEEQDETWPLWVADMDFETAPAIREEVEKRASHGIYGYSFIPDTWAESYSHWFEKRHEVRLKPENLIYSSGIIPALSSVIRKVTTPAEKVVLLTPAYNIFFNSILNNGRIPVECELHFVGKEYQIDFESLEKSLSDPQVSLMILCNPHNPVGRIWSRDELIKIGELARKYGVLIFCDEAHIDLTRKGQECFSFGRLNEFHDLLILALSPSKTFNIAGLQSAGIYVPDSVLRHKVWRGINTDEVGEPNAFSVGATLAAYNYSEEWVDELRSYLDENLKLVMEFIKKEIPGLKPVYPQATYLLWVDASYVTDNVEKLLDFLYSNYGIHLSNGSAFGKGGENFFRLNFALPRKNLKKALNELKKGIEDWLKNNW